MFGTISASTNFLISSRIICCSSVHSIMASPSSRIALEAPARTSQAPACLRSMHEAPPLRKVRQWSTVVSRAPCHRGDDHDASRPPAPRRGPERGGASHPGLASSLPRVSHDGERSRELSARSRARALHTSRLRARRPPARDRGAARRAGHPVRVRVDPARKAGAQPRCHRAGDRHHPERRPRREPRRVGQSALPRSR